MKNKKIIFIFMSVVLLILGGVVFYNHILDYPEKISIYINDEKIILSKKDKDRVINLSSLNADKNNVIQVKTFNKIDIKVNDKKITNYFKKNIGKLEINDENQIKIEIKFKNSKKYTTYYINTLPDNFLEYTTTNNGDIYDGNYYMTSYTADASLSYVFKVNNNGNILYYKKCEGFCSQFRKETSSSGKARYVYNAQDLEASSEFSMTEVYGKMIILDENYELLDEVQYIENDKSNNDKTYTIFEYIDDGHYLVTSSSREKTSSIPNKEEVTLIENNIQEIKDEKIVFEWRSSEHKELYEYIKDPKSISIEEENDYIHINKIIIDPKDNNIIASFRNISTILKIDRKTGDIIWSLGGIKDDFNLNNKQKFEYQHSLSFTSDHSLMVFDNGDNRPALGIKNESRVLKIKLNEKNKKVEKYTEYKLDNVYSMAMGSVQVVDEDNDVFLISFGTGIFSEGPVKLIDFKNNKTLFTFNLLSNKMMFSSQKAD